jgi:phosphoribosyl-AMP cyclohydrolase
LMHYAHASDVHGSPPRVPSPSRRLRAGDGGVAGGLASSIGQDEATGNPAETGGVFVLLGRVLMAIDYSKLAGLVPAVIQDAESAEVLMVGFMNDQALALTRSSGFATFYSRTRNELWMKGETSGNRLQVVDILVDCDEDTLLVKVKRLGEGNVCHTGERTCFFRRLTAEGTRA